MNLYEVLSRFEGEYLSFPPFARAMDEIESMLATYRQAGVVRHLLVLGESGTGKTTLCHAVEQRYPRTSLEEYDVIPVLHVPIPPSVTPAGMLEEILARLGDPSPGSGKVNAKIARAAKLASGCKVELMLLDEAQHAQDRGRARTHYKVGDCLKAVTDEINVPTVMLGLPRTEVLVRVNDQLRRRFTRKLHLAFGQDASATVCDEYLNLLKSVVPVLPVRLNRGDYTWEELGQRLYLATDGRVAYFKSLLSAAIRIVITRNLPQISPYELEQAFTYEIWPEGLGPLNPFNDTFEFRRLSNAGEPFERSSPDGPARKRSADATV
jgi:Bacterial TniB protein